MEKEGFIKRCYELAIEAGKKGHDTFGAILVHNGKILEEAENTADYKKGIFGHAEFNLVHKCANKYPDDMLRESVLFTSCAPCERCLGAIASLGIQTIVCGVSYKEFSRLTPSDYVPVDREGLWKQLGVNIQIMGPVLEEEGMHVFEWWGGDYRPLEELIKEMDAIKKENQLTIMIKKVDNKEEKEKICMEILEGLPEWFEIPESRVSYAKESREFPFFADIENGIVRGFIVMKETSHYTVEIYVMGVRKEYHRLGIGSKLFKEFYQYAKEKGYEFIQVKTVREGVYPEYDLTNAFYQKLGFRELECMDGLWDKANPCQVYVMAVN